GREIPFLLSYLSWSWRAYKFPSKGLLIEWSYSNVSVLVMMLHYFFLASGLKVNVYKSSLYGVGVRNTDVHLMADSFGCLGNNLPFTYLGVKVGDNMIRVNSWIEITWVSWKKVLAHKNQGGLGVNSLYALNLTLMFKWIWRFLSSLSSLWTRVIKSIHGNSGGLENHTSYRVLSWIVKATVKLKDKGIDLMKFCKLVIGNGNVTRFCKTDGAAIYASKKDFTGYLI
ncbi:hypothetical protein Tco_1432559, partial [Tanacetum coccineum]